MALTTRTKRPTHHKKLTGHHHRHNKHYLKTYHPYLPMLLLVVIGLAVNVFWTSKLNVLGAATNVTAESLLAGTNAERYRHRQSSLSINQELNAAAQSKANDMVAKNYWSHNAPDGRTPWAFITKAGYDYQAAGENLAYGFTNAEAAVTGWMNSPEHRANLLNNSYQDVGFGIATAKDFRGDGPVTVIVALYGNPTFPGAAAALGRNNILSSAQSAPPLRSVARIQLLTDGTAPWSAIVITAAAVAAFGMIAVRHWYAWRRMLTNGEAFIVHHKYLDVLFIGIAVAAYVLTRSAGIIH